MATPAEILARVKKLIAESETKIEGLQEILDENPDDPPANTEVQELQGQVKQIQTELQKCLAALSALPKDQSPEIQTLQTQIQTLQTTLETTQTELAELKTLSTRQNSNSSRIRIS